ncbi:MAG TPA: S8/S53 family peptidase [Gemmataceae bacterium]|nr:S8/S53 family peptidase [Gemmataceae bacterium]
MRPAVVLALLLAALAPAAAHASAPVVAIVGESGLNVLHDEFRAATPPVYPAGMPAPVFVDLPRSGTWEQRMAELRTGPLSHLEPGTLYAIRGTRLLVYAPVVTQAGDTGDTDVLDSTTQATDSLAPLQHGTGVTASAIGATTGTAPDALAVFVTGNTDSPAAWSWVAKQRWIDVASISGYVITPNGVCRGGAEARAAIAAGHTIFSSSGNTTDPQEQQVTPNGLPEVYRVGGVDDTGKTWLGPHPDDSNMNVALLGGVTRPYDTGGLYSFMTAAPDSFDGMWEFGGTSGATPRTAGYALGLIDEARRILGGGPAGSAYARLAAGHVPPATGPLADGAFTGDDLESLLRHTATPHEMASPARYLVEGYGAVDDGSIAVAGRVLRGAAPLPARPDEDQAAAAVTAARAAAFSARC